MLGSRKCPLATDLVRRIATAAGCRNYQRRAVVRIRFLEVAIAVLINSRRIRSDILVVGHPVVDAVCRAQHNMPDHAPSAQVGVGVAVFSEIDGASGGETIDSGLVGMAVRVAVAHLDDIDPGLQLGEEGGAG